jgi:hypothetical protein
MPENELAKNRKKNGPMIGLCFPTDSGQMLKRQKGLPVRELNPGHPRDRQVY